MGMDKRFFFFKKGKKVNIATGTCGCSLVSLPRYGTQCYSFISLNPHINFIIFISICQYLLTVSYFSKIERLQIRNSQYNIIFFGNYIPVYTNHKSIKECSFKSSRSKDIVYFVTSSTRFEPFSRPTIS